MTWPTVNVSQKNRYNGTTNDVERVILFVGYGDTNIGKTQSLNTDSDLDKALGDKDSLLKSIVAAAANNAGQNWFAYVHVLGQPDTEAEGYKPDDDWMNAVKQAQSVASVEGILLAFDTTDKATINRATEMRVTLQASFGRFIWFALAVGGPEKDEAWSDYVTRLAEIQDGIASPGVQLVPRLWGTYNWIVEKLNKIPGVNIDLKTVSPPAAAAVPANAVIPDSAAGSSKLNSPSLLTGNRINADIPRGGLMSQVKTDSKTAIDNRKSWGDTYINAPNGITPGQLEEFLELNAG